MPIAIAMTSLIGSHCGSHNRPWTFVLFLLAITTQLSMQDMIQRGIHVAHHPLLACVARRRRANLHKDPIYQHSARAAYLSALANLSTVFCSRLRKVIDG